MASLDPSCSWIILPTVEFSQRSNSCSACASKGINDLTPYGGCLSSMLPRPLCIRPALQPSNKRSLDSGLGYEIHTPKPMAEPQSRTTQPPPPPPILPMQDERIKPLGSQRTQVLQSHPIEESSRCLEKPSYKGLVFTAGLLLESYVFSLQKRSQGACFSFSTLSLPKPRGTSTCPAPRCLAELQPRAVHERILRLEKPHIETHILGFIGYRV